MLAGLIIVGIGILIGSCAIYARHRARQQLSWLRVPATVTSSSVGLGNGFYPDIAYEYVLEGRRFRGVQVNTLSVSTVWPGPARRFIEKYPAGASISIYADPANPENAVIEPGGDPKHLPLWLSIVAVTLFAGMRIIVAAA